MIRKLVLMSVAAVGIAVPAVAGQQLNGTDTWGGGVLVSIDAAAKTVVVRQGEFEQQYRLAEEVTVEDGKSTVAVADLDKGVGRYVRIRYQQDGEARLADLVKVLERRGSVSATASRSKSGDMTSEP